jgi:hypothetical protein
MNQNLRRSEHLMIIKRLFEIFALFFNNLNSVQLGVCLNKDQKDLTSL